MKGIDVSKHQGLIDWGKIPSDIEFVIIRAGYGVNTTDKYFEKNIKQALERGLKVGVYWFLYCLTEEEAIKNAIGFDNVISPYKDKITMKVWCDYEYDSDRYSNECGHVQNNHSRTKIVEAFCNKMIALGYDCGVYANPDYLKRKFDDLSNYPLWLAYYSENEKTAKSYNPFMWQYSSTGKVEGINGNCDMNICYGVAGSDIPDITGFVGVSIVKALSERGYKSSFKYRKELWSKLVRNTVYKGTADQNLKMIELLGGKTEDNLPCLDGYKGFSIVEALRKFGYDSSFKNRAKLWEMIGETSTYKGSAFQNLKLLNRLREN